MPDRRPQQHILSPIHKALIGRTSGGPVPVDWPAVLSTAFTEHLQGLLYRASADLGAPDPVVRTLRNAYYQQAAANVVRIRAVESLEAALSASGIDAMAIKGAALIDSVYADPGLRPMEDMDLLVRPADRKRFEAVLGACGYRRDPVFNHLFAKDGVILDLHAHPLNADRVAGRRHLFPIAPDALWAGSVPWRPGFRHVRRIGDADHVLILAHHLIKHSVSKMIWLVDIHRLLRDRDSLFFCELNRKISDFRQARVMAGLLYLLEAVLGERPAGVRIGSDPAGRLSWIERTVLDIRVRGDAIGDLGNLLWWFCLPDRAGAFQLGLETLFPAKGILMSEQSGMRSSPGRATYLYRSGEILRRAWANLILLVREM